MATHCGRSETIGQYQVHSKLQSTKIAANQLTIKVKELFIAINLGHNLSLQKDGPSLIQPKVFPRFIRNQVSGPRVCRFVCNYIREGAISGKEGGCDER
jgi:hypothetical protein